MRRRILRAGGKVLNPSAIPVPTPKTTRGIPQPIATDYLGRQLVSQAFTLHNEHVFDQLLFQQGTYTNFRSTREDPNLVVDSPGDVELMFRRMTYGDNLLLLAAQEANLKSMELRQQSEDVGNYWELIWQSLILLTWSEPPSTLLRDPLVAVGTALDFVTTARGLERLTMPMLNDTFMRPDSMFYTGVVARYERMREPDSDNFQRGWRIISNESLDHMFMTATLLTLYTIDNHMRGILNMETVSHIPVMRFMERFYETRPIGIAIHEDDRLTPSPDAFDNRYVVDRINVNGEDLPFRFGARRITEQATPNSIQRYIEGRSHGNQETQDDTGPDENHVNPNRLLP